jgi:hypothetical protein
MQFLPREALFYPHDPELERAMRVELYRKQVENDPDRQDAGEEFRKGATSTAVRLADIWGTDTRSPMEFDTTREAAEFLGTKPYLLRLAYREKYRIGGTRIERVEGRVAKAARKVQHKVRIQGTDIVYESIAEAGRQHKIPWQTLKDALKDGGQVGDKVFEVVEYGVAQKGRAKVIPWSPIQTSAILSPTLQFGAAPMTIHA